MGGSLSLSGGTASSPLSSGFYLSSPHADLPSPKFVNDDLTLLFQTLNLPTHCAEASPDVNNPVPLYNVGHFLEAVSEESSYRSPSSSLPLPSPQQAGSDSFSSIAHRDAHSRRRAYPYRRPAQNVRSSTGNAVAHHTGGFPLMGEMHNSPSLGLQTPDPMAPPYLPAPTSFRPSYAHSNKNGWGIDISRPSCSHPHLDLVSGVMRTTLRSSHPQQPSHICKTNTSGFYDMDAFQLEDKKSQPRYTFDLPYSGNDDVG